MEQIITTFGIDWRLLLFQLINFGLALVLLWRFLYRPILRIISERQKKIAEGIADAEYAAREKKSLTEERKNVLHEAALEAESLILSARKSAGTKETILVKEAQGKAQRILDEAGVAAREEKRRMEEESKADVARLIVLGAEKILREKNS